MNLLEEGARVEVEEEETDEELEIMMSDLRISREVRGVAFVEDMMVVVGKAVDVFVLSAVVAGVLAAASRCFELEDAAETRAEVESMTLI